MDPIISMALGQLLFLSIGIGFIGFIVTRAKSQEKRPGTVEQEPQLLKGLKGILNKVPILSKEEQEFDKEQGTFYTTAEFPNTWERVLDSLTRDHIFTDPKYQWRDFRPDQPYRRIQMSVGWREKTTMPSGTKQMSDAVIERQIQLNASISFNELEGGGTALHFLYESNYANDSNVSSIRRGTNKRLKNLCLLLTQDPQRGLPF